MYTKEFKEHIEDRKGILDVRVVNKKGVQIDIEISKLKKAIAINILDFECIPLEK